MALNKRYGISLVAAVVTTGSVMLFQNCAKNSNIANLGATSQNTAKLIFSSSLNGSAQTSFTTTQMVYGRVTGFGNSQVYSCASASTDTICDNPANWVLVPNADWTFDASTSTWRFARTLAEYPANTYKVGFEDRSRNLSTGFVYVTSTAVAAPLAITFSKSIDGAAVNSWGLSDTIYGKVTGLGSTNVWTCNEGTINSQCLNAANWRQVPDGVWSFDASSSAWRISVKLIDFGLPAGPLNVYFEDRASGTKAASAPVQVTCSFKWGSHDFVIGPYYPPETCDSAHDGNQVAGGGGTWTCSCQ